MSNTMSATLVPQPTDTINLVSTGLKAVIRMDELTFLKRLKLIWMVLRGRSTTFSGTCVVQITATEVQSLTSAAIK